MGFKDFFHEFRKQGQEIRNVSPGKPEAPKRTHYGSRFKDDREAWHALMPNQTIHGLFVGRSNYPGDSAPRFITLTDAMKHTFIAGTTGMGKTTLLTHMMLSIMAMSRQDPHHGPGFAFIDPHGDAIGNILRNVPPELEERVHVIHFRRTQYPRSFNFLDVQSVDEAVQATATFITLVQEQWRGQTGNRSDAYLRRALLTLGTASAEGDPQTILGFERLYTDDLFRQRVLQHVRDPELRHFWAPDGEFDSNKDGIRQIIAPLTQKMGVFSSYPPIRPVVGQPRSSINFRQSMDRGDILLIDLSGTPSDISAIIGGMLLNRFHFAALSRRDTPIPKRRPFILLADEFSNYVSDTVADILSEDRKFGLGLILATQYLERVPERILKAVTGNVLTIISLGLNADDAPKLGKSLPGGGVSANDLINQKEYNFMIRTADRQGRKTLFTATFDKEPEGSQETADRIMAMSDQRDGRPLEEVEEELNAFYSFTPTPKSKGKGSGRGSGKRSETGGDPRFSDVEKDALVRPFKPTTSPKNGHGTMSHDIDEHVIDAEWSEVKEPSTAPADDWYDPNELDIP